jgi:predicted homoserine dehydrogenase-like protein
VAKKDLGKGEVLDGEGGYTVVGRLMPAEASLEGDCLPLGLAHGGKMLRAVKAGQPLKWSDVAFDANSTAVKTRREMERTFGRKTSAATLEA